MVLVDSCVWINALKRQGPIEIKLAVEALLECYEARWCSPVRLEVLGGCRVQDRFRLSKYFSVIPYRPCREDDWERGLVLAWHLRENGLSVPWLDVLIAAIAIEDNNRVYSVDNHFRAIADLTTLRLYEPGYGGSYTPE